MGKYLDKTGLTYYHGVLKTLFSKKNHTHTLQVKKGASGSSNSATLSIPNISKKTVVTGGSTTPIPNVTSAGSAPTLGTAFTVPNVTAAGTHTTVSVSNDVLTITNGSDTTLGTAFTIPNVTDVGSAPTLGTAIDAYTSLTTGDSITVGTPTSQGVVTDTTFNTVVTDIAATVSGGTNISTGVDVDPS